MGVSDVGRGGRGLFRYMYQLGALAGAKFGVLGLLTKEDVAELLPRDGPTRLAGGKRLEAA